MQTAFLHRSFNGGEISPLMLSRIDHPRYHTGCKVLKNMVCLPQGPTTRRPGWRFLDEAVDQNINQPERLVPFIFSETESRVIEFSNWKMHVWSDDERVQKDGADYTREFPVSHAHLPDMNFAQSADVIYTAHRNYQPYKLGRLADDDWDFDYLGFTPSNHAPNSYQAIPTIGTPSTGKATYKYVITQIHNGEESLPSEPLSVTTDILGQAQGNYITLQFTWRGTEPDGGFYIYKDRYGEWGYIGKVENNPYGVTEFIDDNIAADTTDTPPSDYNPFDEAGKYPALVFFWSQRLGWSSSLNYPFTVWLSAAGALESLGLSTSAVSDEAIEVTLATTQANEIVWATGEQNILLATTNGVWTLKGIDEGDRMPNFQKQGGAGSAAVQPVIIGGSLLYILQGSMGIGELAYSYQSEKHEMIELSILSQHIFNGRKVAGWCAQSNPYGVVWMYFTDGTYAAMTYLKVHEVIGFHQHETDGFIESMCCIPGDDYDRVYASIIRNIDGTEKRFIERMENYFIESEDASDAFFVDSGVTYDGAPTSVLTEIAPHLAGKTVKIWADGKEQAEKVVAGDGTVNLNTAASKVHVGLGFVSDVVPTRPEVEATQNGTTLSKVYKVSSANLSFYKSANVQVGADDSSLESILQDLNVSNETQREKVHVDTGWTDEWNFLVRASGAAPMTLSSIVYNTEIGEAL